MIKKRYIVAAVMGVILLAGVGIRPFDTLLWENDTITWRSNEQLAVPGEEKLLFVIHDRDMVYARPFWGWIAIDSIPMREVGNRFSVFLLDIPSRHASTLYAMTDSDDLKDAGSMSGLGWKEDRFCATLGYSGNSWACGNTKGEPLAFLKEGPTGLSAPKWNRHFAWKKTDTALLDYSELHDKNPATTTIWVYPKTTMTWQAAVRWVGRHGDIAFFPKADAPAILAATPYPGHIPNSWNGHKRGWNFLDAQVTTQPEKIDVSIECASDHPGVFDTEKFNTIYAPHGAYWQKDAVLADSAALRKQLSPEQYQTTLKLRFRPGDAGIMLVNLPTFGYAAFQVKLSGADEYPGNPCFRYYNHATKAYEGMELMGEYRLMHEAK